MRIFAAILMTWIVTGLTFQAVGSVPPDDNLVRAEKRQLAMRIAIAVIGADDRNSYNHKNWMDPKEVATYSHDVVEGLYAAYPK